MTTTTLITSNIRYSPAYMESLFSVLVINTGALRSEYDRFHEIYRDSTPQIVVVPLRHDKRLALTADTEGIYCVNIDNDIALTKGINNINDFLAH